MVVMPSNWIVKTDDGLAIRLLEILPLKVEHIADDLQAGIVRRTRPKLLDRIFSRAGNGKRGSKVLWTENKSK